MNKLSQKSLRLMVSIYACAYECFDYSLVDDFYYDELAAEVDVEVETGDEKLDKFFKEKYSPFTGHWVLQHPNLNEIKETTKLKIEEHKELKQLFI
jgi:hypothetical protein